jgi:hypothetical protein
MEIGAKYGLRPSSQDPGAVEAVRAPITSIRSGSQQTQDSRDYHSVGEYAALSVDKKNGTLENRECQNNRNSQ